MKACYSGGGVEGIREVLRLNRVLVVRVWLPANISWKNWTVKLQDTPPSVQLLEAPGPFPGSLYWLFEIPI